MKKRFNLSISAIVLGLSLSTVSTQSIGKVRSVPRVNNPNPTLTSMMDNVGLVQGVVTSGATTDDTTLTFNGTAGANVGVTVYAFNGTTNVNLGSVTANGLGEWTLTPSTPLPSGSYNLGLVSPGTTGPVSGGSVVIEEQVPTIDYGIDEVGSTPAYLTNGSSSDDVTPLLFGTAPASSTVLVYDGSVLLGTTTASMTGDWSFTSPSLALGLHTLTVKSGSNLGTPSSVFNLNIIN